MTKLLEIATEEAKTKAEDQLAELITDYDNKSLIAARELSNAVFDRRQILGEKSNYPEIELAKIQAYTKALTELSIKITTKDSIKDNMDSLRFRDILPPNIRNNIATDPFIVSSCNEVVKAYQEKAVISKGESKQDSEKLYDSIFEYYKTTYKNVKNMCINDFKKELSIEIEAATESYKKISEQLEIAKKNYHEAKTHAKKAKQIDSKIDKLSEHADHLSASLIQLKKLKKDYTPLTIIMIPTEK